MSKSLRLSEKWFNYGLWLVALVFASFLIGLGSTVVGDLPRVEQHLQREDFIDKAAAAPLRGAISAAQSSEKDASDALDQAELKLNAAAQAYASERDSFDNWTSTRAATSQPAQDGALIARTRTLDTLKRAESAAQRDVEVQRQRSLDAQQAQGRARDQLSRLEAAADVKLEDANNRIELRVFLYRLALTLPLLVVAGWLFVRQRKSQYWPFVWGFILFALFAFFVELVPYLPSYGGYVRYIVGIIITVAIGRYVIIALGRYLAAQRLAEAQPETIRRNELSYDVALARLAKNVCPGCERPVDLKAGDLDFCPHCGIGLFDHCTACSKRKSSFAQFCHACGVAAKAS